MIYYITSTSVKNITMDEFVSNIDNIFQDVKTKS